MHAFCEVREAFKRTLLLHGFEACIRAYFEVYRIFFRACHGLFVWAGPDWADLKIVTGRARPGRDF